MEEYLEELESVSIHVEGDNGTEQDLNFAEAALLIQGSTAVYSRKVEYLHSLVLRALELVADQKKADKSKNQQSSAGQQESERSIEEMLCFGSEPDQLLLDDIPEGTKIDLEVDYDNFEDARYSKQCFSPSIAFFYRLTFPPHLGVYPDQGSPNQEI